VFVIDCTYKTNKFGLPFMNIVGITATYASFNAGFAFLQQETFEYYEWALGCFANVVKPRVIATDREVALMSAIKTVFPEAQNVLCVWHIEKNVLAHTSKYFAEANELHEFLKLWTSCVRAENEEEYASKLCELEESNSSAAWEQALSYVRDVWLPHSDRFLRHKTNGYMHLGTISTSRGEGNHHALKTYLKTPRCDMLMVFDRLKLMLQNQFVEHKQSIEAEKISTSDKHLLPCLRKLVGRVSKFALTKISEQARCAQQDGCTRSFTSVWGLPCKHRIWQLEHHGYALDPSEVHMQWHLDGDDLVAEANASEPAAPLSPRSSVLSALREQLYSREYSDGVVLAANVGELLRTGMPHLQEPQVVTRRRGRPKNRRDKSAFEYVHGNKCSRCGGAGHNARTCTQ